eukprot:CAMPEP_0202975898 /NCGR_PEP_ID=MMETSP1396-20130829/73055_1 /ASSEMBLY_ACC=CAM_ASM_000872 /TAXON_ID= /ORGANISM="Pseudokeronopsis sp., Strain Brazil" /LENGTH=150 /DNA_ID=CAMNT_0049712349 /DNA_START=156 /DNA_END=605 /DNA_ORIENTATION=+
MHNPRIDLVEEYFVAAEEDLGEHVLDYGVSSGALLIDCIQQLTSLQIVLLDVLHHLQQSRKHLVVDCKFDIEALYGDGPVSEVLVLDGQQVLLVDVQDLAHPRTKRLHIHAHQLNGVVLALILVLLLVGLGVGTLVQVLALVLFVGEEKS